MQFQLATDYAFRILDYMNENDEKLMTAVHMAEHLGITYLYFMKIISKLKAAGIVLSVQGCNGGYRLKKPADEISVYEVIETMEGGIYINRCLMPDGYCSREATKTCKMHKYFESVQNGLIEQLKEKKIAEI